jgi:hypothetical protein
MRDLVPVCKQYGRATPSFGAKSHTWPIKMMFSLVKVALNLGASVFSGDNGGLPI